MLAGSPTADEVEQLKAALYEMLTTADEYAALDEEARAALFRETAAHRAWYQSAIEAIETHIRDVPGVAVADNPAWFSLKASPEHKQEQAVTYKQYFTLPVDQYTCIQALPDLAQKLRAVRLACEDAISLKVPRTFRASSRTATGSCSTTGARHRVTRLPELSLIG